MADPTKVKIVEKSRRIGLTWGEAGEDALLASAAPSAGGMDVFYMGYNMEMAREFISDCADWARGYSIAASELAEAVFDDMDAHGNSRAIRAYRIDFPSGFKIMALSSAPRSLRGIQGKIVIDEAAFHDDLGEVLKAAMAMLLWGGRVVIISTHNGEDNLFNELIQDCLAGKRPYSVHRIDFDKAIAQGLYRRVCLRKGMAWTAAGEAAWRQETIDFYGDNANEELFCIPRQGGGAWLTRALIEARMRDTIPVIRWNPPKGFVDWREAVRDAEVADWCRDNLLPLLNKLDPSERHFLGEDFARSSDLTVMWPLARRQNLSLYTPFTVELRDTPFTAQEQILKYICDRLPRFTRGALDAGGNGAFLAERARQKYGAGRIDEVKFTVDWYREHMPRMKASFEDGNIEIPRDADVLDDFRAIVLVKGVARVPDLRAKDAEGKYRHGDSAIAAALAVYAANIEGPPSAGASADPGEADYRPELPERAIAPGQPRPRVSDFMRRGGPQWRH